MMQAMEVLNRLHREHDRIKERFNETDYDQGYLRGLEKAMNICKAYMDEEIERMAALEEKIHMEDFNGETD